MKCISPRGWAIALAAIALALSAQPVKASFWTFSDASNRAATADFNVSGNTLTVTLTNTATVAPNDPAHVLTALFFNYSGPGSVNFTPLGMGHTAALASGSANYAGNYNGFANDIGGEWAFKSSVHSFSYGLSSTGLGDFAPGDRFNNNDLSPPDDPDGVQWGIVNSGYQDGDGNGGIKNEPFVRNTATFTFTVSNDFNVDNITSTFFLYGTAYGEGGGGGGGGNAVPAPAGLILLASALPVFAFRRLIRRKTAVA